MSEVITLMSQADTQRIAQALAALAKPGDVLALTGEVGAGKTTFAQAFIAALLAAPEPVTSPTFTLMQSYQSAQGWPIMHVDLYRLKHASELSELGLEDFFPTHVTLVEWPEIAQDILPRERVDLHFHHTPESRTLVISSESERYRHCAERFAA